MVPFQLDAGQFAQRYRRELDRVSSTAITAIRSFLRQPTPPSVMAAEVVVEFEQDEPYAPSATVHLSGVQGRVVDGPTLPALGFEAMEPFDPRYFTPNFGGLELAASAISAWLAECWWKAGGWDHPIPTTLVLDDGVGAVGKAVRLTDREPPRWARAQAQ